MGGEFLEGGKGGKREGKRRKGEKTGKEKGGNGEEKKENCKMGGEENLKMQNNKWKGKGMKVSRVFFFFFSCHFLKPLKFVWGVPKWKFLQGKKSGNGKFFNLAHL